MLFSSARVALNKQKFVVIWSWPLHKNSIRIPSGLSCLTDIVYLLFAKKKEQNHLYALGDSEESTLQKTGIHLEGFSQCAEFASLFLI